MSEEMFAVWALIALVGMFVFAFVVFAGLTLRLEFKRWTKVRKIARCTRSVDEFIGTMKAMGDQADITAQQLLELSLEWEKSNLLEDPEAQSATTKEKS
jgi:hypothetical protein